MQRLTFRRTRAVPERPECVMITRFRSTREYEGSLDAEDKKGNSEEHLGFLKDTLGALVRGSPPSSRILAGASPLLLFRGFCL